jgi:DNA replication protein DnaC
MRHPNIDRLRQMRLSGMAKALEELDHQPDAAGLSFDERLALLIEREAEERANAALAGRLRRANFRQQACLENLDMKPSRGLDRGLVRELASCRWIRDHRPVVVVGATGTGKTWLVCALGHQAAREGYSVQYTRLTRLLDGLATARVEGKLARELRRLARLDLLIIDDWGMTELTAAQRLDLMEVIDDRHDRRATLLASQIPVDRWHAVIGDPTYADAILDRVVHQAYRLELAGESMRKHAAAKAGEEAT